MRSIFLMAIFMASFSSAAAGDYTETRDLTLSARGLEKLVIDAGAGSLDVTGIDGLKRIEVKATIVVPDAGVEDGKEIVARELVLSLKEVGGEARLKSDFAQRFWGSGSNRRVDLEVRAPASLALAIDDGSGSMDVANFTADVRIDDGSGSIDVRRVGNLRIHDGSGSIDVVGVNGDVFVNDGSGSISIDGVGGSVTIDDGSGGIRVSDVAADLIILDDGSGGVTHSNIRGTVKEEG
jgi:DUF4097 and DUF4098 domain-containing protein YvlB